MRIPRHGLGYSRFSMNISVLLSVKSSVDDPQISRKEGGDGRGLLSDCPIEFLGERIPNRTLLVSLYRISPFLFRNHPRRDSAFFANK